MIAFCLYKTVTSNYQNTDISVYCLPLQKYSCATLSICFVKTSTYNFWPISSIELFWLYKRQPHKMVIHTQTIHRQQPTNCLSVLDHFVGLALKGLRKHKTTVWFHNKLQLPLINLLNNNHFKRLKMKL